MLWINRTHTHRSAKPEPWDAAVLTRQVRRTAIVKTAARNMATSWDAVRHLRCRLLPAVPVGVSQPRDAHRVAPAPVEVPPVEVPPVEVPLVVPHHVVQFHAAKPPCGSVNGARVIGTGVPGMKVTEYPLSPRVEHVAPTVVPAPVPVPGCNDCTSTESSTGAAVQHSSSEVIIIPAEQSAPVVPPATPAPQGRTFGSCP